MSASTAGTPCAALELTHGGLNSKERPEWAESKKNIPIDLKQQHYDEIAEDVSTTTLPQLAQYELRPSKNPVHRRLVN